MAITIDEMLEFLSSSGPELANGNANHGPMAAEALFEIDRAESVLPWVEGYKSRLADGPQTTLPISSFDWRETLGDRGRLGDWIAFFDNELAEAPWQETVRVWVPQLAPAIMSAAAHGLLRTSHAVRSLSYLETPQRLHELAQGLGYWAARYQLLPGSPSGGITTTRPQDALWSVKRIHGPEFQPQGNIAQELGSLDEHPSFDGVVDLVGTSGDLSHYISNLTETFAGVYLANSRNLVAFVHAVTAPSALRMLAPYLSDGHTRLAARYAWQACAAVYAWYSEAPPRAEQIEPVLEPPEENRDELIDRAVAAGGAHSIKFTEACLREYALNPKPVYLAAARDVSERVGQV